VNLLDRMRQRAALRRTLRAFFDARGFDELETPILIAANAPEPFLEALAVDVTQGGHRQRGYLRTSPELAIKRLLAAGLQRGYEWARVFRDDEQGALHRVEFTLLEWYRAGAGYTALMDDCDALLEHCCRALGLGPVVTGPHGPCDLGQGCERLSMGEAFARHAGVELEHHLPDDGRGLRAAALRAGVSLPPAVRDDEDPSFESVFFPIFLSAVEPALGRARPTLLHEWPAPLGALARRKPGDPRLALRFELYAAGLELANAFDELTDPVEQAARFAEERAARQAAGRDPYPVPGEFLQDLARVPPSCGIALGVERLQALLHGQPDLEQAALPWAL
jgi:lysyl-tRNA synthetase class 2